MNNIRTKTYISSSVSDVNDNIKKARKRLVLMFDFDCCESTYLCQIWRQACILSLQFGTEFTSVVSSLFQKLKRYQLAGFSKIYIFCARL